MDRKHRKILAVDDNADNLIALGAVLAEVFPDTRVATALDGATALTLARAEDPDVILLDIAMPGMDGYEVCRRLKADQELLHIPVVFLTAARTDRDSRVKALEVGAEGFLSKPVDESELQAQLRAMAKVRDANDLKRAETIELASLVATRTRELELELSERRAAEAQLQQAHAELRRAHMSTVILLEDLQAENTARRRSEEASRLSLEEKTALLKEVHHRVKNNLQIVVSLLRMQARQITNPEAIAVLGNMQSRVYSMALIHETLYGSENLARINMASYIQRLCRHLVQALVAHASTLELTYDLAPVSLAIDQAVPCGLLVNELVSNSIKYAYPAGSSGGVVRIELQPVAGGPAIRLRVSDAGVGLPPGFDVERANSLGLQLATSLAGQLGGRLEIGPGPGAAFAVEFTPAKQADLPPPLPGHGGK